jgi:hypothetical protein
MPTGRKKPYAPLLILIGLSLALSCTRMPTAPRTGVVVHGTITGPAGEPVERTLVAFTPQEKVLPDSTFNYTRTGPDGTYSMPLLPGDYELRIVPSAHPWLGYTNLVRVSDEHDRFDYAFHGHQVTGRLLDPTGALVTNGWVSARIESPHPSDAVAHVEQGTFSLLLPSGSYSLTGEVAGYFSGIPSRTITGVPIQSDTTFDLELTGVPVQGTVTGPDGAPMPLAEVEIWPQRVLTNDAGAYRIFAEPGVHAIRCFPPEGQSEILSRTAARNVTGPTTVDFDLRGIVWSGTVRFAGSLEPADGHSVWVETPPPDNRAAVSWIGPAGEFRVILEANRSYDLHVRPRVWGDLDPPEYAARFRATADTTFDILIPPPPSP